MLHNSQKDFLKRHIGPSDEDQNKMLKKLNYKSLDDLIKSTVPEKIQLKDELNIGESNSEYEALRKLKAISKKDTKVFLEVRGKKHAASICSLPFYKKSYVKGANK